MRLALAVEQYCHYTDYCYRKVALIATPLTFKTPGQVVDDLASHIRSLRLEASLTQAGLARRAGIPYATLRVFERTGRISLLSFVKLVQTLNRDGALLTALAPTANPYTSIDQVVNAAAAPKRKRGSIG